MMDARDLTGYGGKPPQANWSGNARMAVQFVLNIEEGAISAARGESTMGC